MIVAFASFNFLMSMPLYSLTSLIYDCYLLYSLCLYSVLYPSIFHASTLKPALSKSLSCYHSSLSSMFYILWVVIICQSHSVITLGSKRKQTLTKQLDSLTYLSLRK